MAVIRHIWVTPVFKGLAEEKKTVKGVEKEIPYKLEENEEKCQGNENRRKFQGRERGHHTQMFPSLGQ